MKRRKIINMILVFIILFIICSLKTTYSKAAFPVDENTSFDTLEREISGGINLTYEAAYRNQYVFCRELREWFPSDRVITYVLDSNKNNPEEHINDEVSYLLNSSSQYTGYIGTYGMRDCLIQQLLWRYLGQGFFSANNEIFEAGRRYATYGENLTGYYRIYNTYAPKIETENKIECDSEGNYIIGKIIIPQYPFDSNLEFGGITGIEVLDESNNKINCILLDSNKQEFNSVIDLNSYSKDGFYVKVSKDNIGNNTNINLKIKYKYLATRSKIYYIKSTERIQYTDYYTCEEHRDDKNIKVYGGRKYIKTSEHGSSTSNSKPSYTQMEYIDNYYRYYELQGPFYICGKGHKRDSCKQMSAGAQCIVQGCGSGIDHTEYTLYWTGYKLFNCSNCHYINGSYYPQKLVIASHDKEQNENEFNVQIPLIPPIQIQLEKYNSYSASTDRLLNAKFNVVARQDRKEIYNQNIRTTDGKLNININPRSRKPVYLTITEINTPAGYRTIDPICIKYELHSNNRVWDPGISNVENWKAESGFESYSGWTHVAANDENGTALPNTYQSNNNGDKIYVDQNENTKIYTLKVYNEPKIDLKLIKVDNNDRNLKLSGAKFSGKISGVNSLKYGGTTYTKNPEEVIDFKDLGLVTDKNGEINTTFTDIVFDGESTTIVITIEEVEIPNSNTDAWYYKKLDYPITINITFTKSDGITDINWQKNGNTEEISVVKTGEQVIEITVPNKRLIDISGKVWLDGNTGIKPVVGPDGKMGDNEEALEGILVKLVGGTEKQTKTNIDGTYSFTGLDYGPEYSIKFTYDGINYEDTTYYKDAQGNIIGDSKAQESADERTTFNNKFKTIEKGKATNSGIKLEYITTENQESKSSTSKLNTHNTTNGELNVKDFGMTATAETNDLRKDNENHTISTSNINFGLVKRGTDLALSTDLVNAEVTINGKNAEYRYNAESNSLEIGPNQTFNNKQYNLNLYSSDYNYRIRDYVSNSNFKNVDNTGDTTIKTGDELKVYVRYKVNLQNQLTKTAYINEVKYTPDSRYTYNEELTIAYNAANNGITHMQTDTEGNNIIINLDGLRLEELETKTLYLVFEVNLKDLNGTFSNTAEITSYSTDEGLIDVDSAPGNCEGKDGIHEDDCDKSGGLTITVNENDNRTITGTVFDSTKKENVNGVIVQLIELKKSNGKYYEYIWQETTSGSNKVDRMNSAGTAIETYYTNVTDKGTYKFQGYIPGNYIIRFIYGDGSSYDSVHNGQDYKSVVDSKYNEEWYNKANYTQGASIARDNEARRLETMAYSVNVDARKGLLLKLLDGIDVNRFNEVEKATLTTILENKELTEDNLKTLLDDVLNNTWMCAETSKVNVEVDGEKASYTDMNFGMEKRPQTKIELKKYITGFKLTASNGQTLVNATVDVNEYFNNPGSISSKIQGIRDNLSVTNTYWSYEVSPTDINTIVEGANLEYVYDLVVENNSDNDYLSETLKNAYETKNIDEYATYLTNTAKTVKGEIQEGKHTYGEYLGAQYYAGGTNDNKVKTEVTQLKDYVNDNLRLVGVNLTPDQYEEKNEKHYVLNDAYGLDEKDVKTFILKGTSKKLEKDEWTDMSTVTLGKDSLSASGKLDIDNYIAEVIAYTNAAGRRADTTPANAEFVSKGVNGIAARTHEKDEADTARIGIGAATGNDEKTPYVWLITIVAGIVIVAAGVVITKKYIIK